MGHPFSKFISIKSRLSEHLFKKCGKQDVAGVAVVANATDLPGHMANLSVTL